MPGQGRTALRPSRQYTEVIGCVDKDFWDGLQDRVTGHFLA